jgi:SAM-dependent methyltransferase
LSVRRLVKSAVKGLFGLAGLDVRRLHPPEGPRPYQADVKSAIEHNSPGRLQELYASPGFLTEEFSPDRLAFYTKVVDEAMRRGIVFDRRRVLDIGCGAGYLLKEVKRRAPSAHVTGTEYVAAALEAIAGVMPEAERQALDITRERLPSTFDVVFCTEVLEHLLRPHDALAHIVAMVAPGGVAVLTVPNGRIDTFAGHINFWSPESWPVFLEAARPLSIEAGLVDDTNFGLLRRAP